MNIKQIPAFTLVELIVTTTIIVILGTVSYISFSQSIPDTRDAQRLSDLAKIESAMKVYKQNKGAYPIPGNSFDILIGSGNIVAFQGKLNEKVPLSLLSALPLDPKLDIPYIYSTTKNRSEFQLAGTLENSENEKAIVRGDFTTVSKNQLPTIILAVNSTTDVLLDKTKFIFDENTDNLPYNFLGNIDAVSNNIPLAEKLNSDSIQYQSTTKYSSCLEIFKDKKSVGDGDYQVRTKTGSIATINCNFASLSCPSNTDYQSDTNRCYAATNSSCSVGDYNIVTDQCETTSINTIAKNSVEESIEGTFWTKPTSNRNKKSFIYYRGSEIYGMFSNISRPYFKDSIRGGLDNALFFPLMATHFAYVDYTITDPGTLSNSISDRTWATVKLYKNILSCPTGYTETSSMCEQISVIQGNPSCTGSIPGHIALREAGRCYVEAP